MAGPSSRGAERAGAAPAARPESSSSTSAAGPERQLASPPGRPRRRTTGAGRRRVGLFLAAGLVVTIALAVLVSPYASSQPDGLEKVAADRGIDRDAVPHALDDSPLADYGVEGLDDSRLGTGLAGLVGVLATFAVGSGVVLLARRRRHRPAAAPRPG